MVVAVVVVASVAINQVTWPDGGAQNEMMMIIMIEMINDNDNQMLQPLFGVVFSVLVAVVRDCSLYL